MELFKAESTGVRCLLVGKPPRSTLATGFGEITTGADGRMHLLPAESPTRQAAFLFTPHTKVRSHDVTDSLRMELISIAWLTVMPSSPRDWTYLAKRAFLSVVVVLHLGSIPMTSTFISVLDCIKVNERTVTWKRPQQNTGQRTPAFDATRDQTRCWNAP